MLELTKQEKDALIKLIINEQIKYLIPNKKYDKEEYLLLEQLKQKLYARENHNEQGTNA